MSIRKRLLYIFVTLFLCLLFGYMVFTGGNV